MAKRLCFNMAAAKREAGAKAQIVEVSDARDRLNKCSWCRKKKLTLICEYVAEGIWWTDFLRIYKCANCGKATIFTHQSEDESNV